MDTVRAIPPPPPPPPEPVPPGGTIEWARWQLRNSFTPDHAVIIEYMATWPSRGMRNTQYVMACFTFKWAGWQAQLAHSVMETLAKPLQVKQPDGIPF